MTTAPVVAQVGRSPNQAHFRQFLRGCEVVPLAASDAHEVGVLAGPSGVTDVVAVHVVLVASAAGAPVLTSDDRDLGRISTALRDPVRLMYI